ncbi:MAG: DUF3320 domain-containing protein [Candidatus Merdivicinus sp.]|jgi:hypothetical protein
MKGRLIAEIAWRGIVCEAMRQNHIPLVRKLILKNMGEQPICNVLVSLFCSPEFATGQSWEIPLIPAGESIQIDAVDMPLSEEFLSSVVQQENGILRLEVVGEDGLLLQEEYTVKILAPHDWCSADFVPELSAAYVTPCHPAILKLIEEARKLLKNNGTVMNFTGYQCQKSDAVRQQMTAVYETLRLQQIVLEEDSSLSFPPVRFADSILQEKAASALDWCFLYAACLEAVGLHPLLIFGHKQIFVGCWLEPRCFPEAIQDDISVLSNRMDDTLQEILVIAPALKQDVSFEQAADIASRHILGGSFQFLLDIYRARAGGIQPLCLGWEEIPCLHQTETTGNTFLINGENAADVEEPMATRQQIWERKLLDLSLRNMLVNFRATKRTLQILGTDYVKLEDALSAGNEFQVLGRPADYRVSGKDTRIFHPQDSTPALEMLLSAEMENGRLRAFLSEEETIAAMTAIYRQAKISLEENGSNTLFLAIGFLKWYESDLSEKPRYAPLVLLPVDIIRKSSQRGFLIRLRDEDPQMNITLLEMLRQDFGMTISGLDPLPRDQMGINLSEVFRIIRREILLHPRWDVEKMAFLGLFSFSQFIMWSDIRNRAEDLKRSKIVRSLMSGKLEWQPATDFPQPENLDEQFRPEDLALPITADASQISAVCAAGQGKSFVLHGPPGTGKSQTITNIIANALYHGKTVLFLAEKMAALSVVQKRLEKIGLGPFALELHSNKAKKRDVLSQLEQTLQIGHIRPAEDYNEQAARLYELRKELNAYVQALHTRHMCGFSAWEAITRYESCQDAPADICFLPEDIDTLNPRKLQVWEDIAEEMQTAATACGNPSEHPLREWNLTAYSSSVRSELGNRLDALGEDLKHLQKLLAEFCGELNVPADGPYPYLKDLVQLADFLRKDSELPACLLTSGDLAPLQDALDALCDGGRRRDAARDALFITYRREILLFNEPTARREWEKASDSWILPRFLGQNRIWKALRELAKDPHALMKEQVESCLNLLAEYDQGTREIAAKEHIFASRFGPLWNAREPDWRKLELVFEKALAVQEVTARIVPDEEKRRDVLLNAARRYLSSREGENDRIYRELSELIDAFDEVEREVERIWDLASVRNDRESGRQLERLSEYQKRWSENLSLLRDWCNWTAVQQRANQEGLGILTGACWNGAIEPEQILAAYHRGLYAACADRMIEQEPALSSFHSTMFEAKIQKFRRISNDYEQLTRSELVARLSAKIPAHSADIAASSEIGILQKAIRSGGRTLSIRRLFDSIPNLLRMLCPCMLMSPISVAQYIDPQYPPFDLVVFDEASQLPTCEAVGAIARGENVIIVGDPKQLPPTSFFVGTHVDEDNLEQEDLESILDDCLAISMPEEHLRWHYRSRHESLIAFSNRQYYDNRLYTFPSPNDLESRVTLIPVQGSYDRGRSKQNRAEAEAVVAEILRRLGDPVLAKDSIGVVTFSAVQQNLIEDLLLEAFCLHPELEERSAAAEEPVFVKNLENVQGDERDVILFSIGYGPDESGKVALNFGPLNREGGWRRLNVAVSRARKEMRIYSTLRADQIDLSKTRSEGVAGLKAFLEFAEKGYAALPTPIEQITVDQQPFAEMLAAHIRRMGFEVRTNVGCSGFRIDLAVVDPRYPTEYLLGILCDGEYYLAGQTARDRNMNQESVLRSLGWHLYHCWVLEWREDPTKELFRIREAIEEALRQEHLAPVPTPPEEKRSYHFDQTKLERAPEPEDERQPYLVCHLPQKSVTPEDFCNPVYDAEILMQMKKVLEMEAPISGDLLCRRIMNAWGIARMAPRIERRLAPLLEKLPGTQTHCNEKTFYWTRKRGPRKYADFRVPDADQFRRDAEDIPPEEFANAIRYVLERQIGLPREDLIRAVYRLFGFQRVGSSILETAEAGIQMAIRRGYAVADEDRFVLPPEYM